jgi:hypothetical protein
MMKISLTGSSTSLQGLSMKLYLKDPGPSSTGKKMFGSAQIAVGRI